MSRVNQPGGIPQGGNPNPNPPPGAPQPPPPRGQNPQGNPSAGPGSAPGAATARAPGAPGSRVAPGVNPPGVTPPPAPPPGGTHDNPDRDPKRVLTRAGMEAVIRGGGSVLHGGRVINSANDLPTEEDLSAGDPAARQRVLDTIAEQRAALDRQELRILGGGDTPPLGGARGGRATARGGRAAADNRTEAERDAEEDRRNEETDKRGLGG